MSWLDVLSWFVLGSAVGRVLYSGVAFALAQPDTEVLRCHRNRPGVGTAGKANDRNAFRRNRAGNCPGNPATVVMDKQRPRGAVLWAASRGL